jgi:hypothetical protein
MIIGLVTFSVACNDDDDKVDCEKIEGQIDDLEDDYNDAWEDEDCERIGDLYDELIALVKKGKSCDFVDDMIDDWGADDFDDFIDMLEDERDADVNDCENPPV